MFWPELPISECLENWILQCLPVIVIVFTFYFITQSLQMDFESGIDFFFLFSSSLWVSKYLFAFFVLFFIKIWRFAHLTSIILHRFLKSLGKDEIWVLVGMVLMKWIYSLNIFALIWWFFVRGASNLSRMAKNVMFSFFSKLNRKQA